MHFGVGFQETGRKGRRGPLLLRRNWRIVVVAIGVLLLGSYYLISLGKLQHQFHEISADDAVNTNSDGDFSDVVDFTLVTHGTIDRLQAFEKIAERWTGPIAVAWFLRDVESEWPKINSSMQAIRKARNELNPTLPTATNATSSLQFCLFFTSKELYPGYYPVNVLRNRALQLADTDFVLLVDIDLLPDSGLYAFLRRNGAEMATRNRGKHKEAYVVPLFQMRSSQYDIPHDLTELTDSIHNGKVSAGYVYPEHVGHSVTDYDQWYSIGSDESPDRWYSIKFVNRYEPYVVVPRKHIPLWDEHFVRYSHDKTSFTFHLHKKGFVFVVIPNHFVVHLWHKKAEWARQVNHTQTNRMYRDFKRAFKT